MNWEIFFKCLWLSQNISTLQVKRVVEVFDADLNGEVDFKEFVMGLAQFRFEFIHYSH